MTLIQCRHSTGQGTVAVLCAGKVTSRAPQDLLYIHLQELNGLRKGDEHPTYTAIRCIALCYFNFILSKAIH